MLARREEIRKRSILLLVVCRDVSSQAFPADERPMFTRPRHAIRMIFHSLRPGVNGSPDRLRNYAAGTWAVAKLQAAPYPDMEVPEVTMPEVVSRGFPVLPASDQSDLLPYVPLQQPQPLPRSVFLAQIHASLEPLQVAMRTAVCRAPNPEPPHIPFMLLNHPIRATRPPGTAARTSPLCTMRVHNRFYRPYRSRPFS